MIRPDQWKAKWWAAAGAGAAIAIAAVLAVARHGINRDAAARQAASAASPTLLVEPGAATGGGVLLGGGGTRILTARDAEEISRQCPAVDDVAPVVNARAQLVYGHRNWMPTYVYGTTPSFVSVCDWDEVVAGAMFGDQDVRAGNTVCVIGETVREKLFDAEPAVGKQVRIEDAVFRIIGVLNSKCANMMGVDQDDIVLIPWTTIKSRVAGAGGAHSSGLHSSLRRFYRGSASPYAPRLQRHAGRLSNIDRILVRAASGVDLPLATQQIIALLRQRHNIGPQDANDFNIRGLAEVSK